MGILVGLHWGKSTFNDQCFRLFVKPALYEYFFFLHSLESSCMKEGGDMEERL